MAKDRKTKRKKKQEREKRRQMRRAVQRHVTPRAERGLNKALDHIERKEWTEAAELLGPLQRRHPKNTAILETAIACYQELGDYHSLAQAARKLASLRPDDPVAVQAVAVGYLKTARFALALREFRRLERRWPEMCDEETRDIIAQLEAGMQKSMPPEEWARDDAIETVAANEEAIVALNEGRHEDVVRQTKAILSRRPDYVAALNNLAQAYLLLGRHDEAMAACRRVLDKDPENHHALGNLARLELFSGRADEAREIAQRLRRVQSDRDDLGLKKMETFSFLGDDEAVLEAADEYGDRMQSAPPAERALFHHLAAVAHYRRGDEAEARKLWSLSLAAGSLSVATENLADLKNPLSERNAAWPYSLDYFLGEDLYQGFCDMGERIAENRPGADRQMRRFLDQHPQLEALVPVLLDRGDPPGRRLAYMIARFRRTPAMLDALRDFALGRRGPDELRMSAAQIAREEGALADSRVELWIDGEPKEIRLLAFEVYEEQVEPDFPEDVQQLYEESYRALEDGEAEEGERLIREALKRAPHARSLVNNLVASLQMQDRHEEARELARKNLEEHPDYLFARMTMANLHIHEGRFEEARELLEPIMDERRLHITEFRSLANGWIALWYAKGDKEAARSWLETFERIDPESPALASWRIRLADRPLNMLRAWGRQFLGSNR